MRRLCILVAANAAAAADDREARFILSFAPLDHTIPACDRLIDSGELGDAKTEKRSR